MMTESPDEIIIPTRAESDQQLVDEPPRRRMGLLTYTDAAIAIGAVLLAMWQLLEVDRDWMGFVLCFGAVPLLMLAARWWSRARAVSAFATVYLVLLGIGTMIAKMPSVMPALSFEHPADTKEAETFNQLDVVSRRVITWNMGQNMLILPALLGYVLFLVPLRRRDPDDISTATCVLGLLVLWGMSGLLLIFVLVALLRSGGDG